MNANLPMTLQDLDKQDACKHLLEAPAPLVVGKLIAELRRYIQFTDKLKQIKRHPIDEDVIDALLQKYEI